MTAPVRVVIADDQRMVRDALRATLSRRDDVEVVGEAGDGEQAVDAAVELRPDVVLMDVRMPVMTGVEATARILGDWPHSSQAPHILMLTTFDLDEYVHAALRAGATGFILKNASTEQLAGAIHDLVAGHAALSPSVTRRLVATVATLPPPLPARATDGPAIEALTPREREVLLLVSTGLSNKQIARRLGVSESSVKSSVNRAMGRLNVSNRVQAALLVRGTPTLAVDGDARV